MTYRSDRQHGLGDTVCSGWYSYFDPTCWGYMAGQAAGDLYTGKVPAQKSTGDSAGDFFNMFAPEDVPTKTTPISWVPLLAIGGVVAYLMIKR